MLDLTAWGFDTVDIEPALIGGMIIEDGERATIEAGWVTKALCRFHGKEPPPAEEVMVRPPTVSLWIKGVEEPLRFQFANAMTIARNRMQAHAFADYVREQCRKRNTGVEAAFGRDAMRAA